MIDFALSSGSNMIDKNNPQAWIEAMFRAIDTGSWADFSQFFHPDVVYERPGYADICGFDALLDFYRNVRIIAQGKHTLVSALADDSHAICWGQFNGRSREGDALCERFADAYELKEGLIRKRTTYFFRAAI